MHLLDVCSMIARCLLWSCKRGIKQKFHCADFHRYFFADFVTKSA